MIAVIALVSVACGSSEDATDTSATTAEATTTSATSSTTTTPTTSTATDATATSGSTEPVGSTVTVYFSTGDGSDCSEVTPFTRTIDDDATMLDSAILELLAGPTEEEIAAGASSFFSSETATSLTLVDRFTPGLLIIGFDDLQALIPNASTSCGSEALLAQLNSTILQYEPRVRYEMLGSCQLFANWLQRECMDYSREGAEPAVLSTSERATGSGCEPPIYGIGNGQWFGYVDSATDAAIEFDIACWFDGDAAVDAASEDGEESPPPNSYYVRNDDDLVVSVAVAPTASVSWLPDVGDPASEVTVSFGEWATQRDSRPEQLGVWLTVRDEQVVEVVEQYAP